MKLKEIRESRGISQRQAAIALNLSPTVYNRYENGLREPSNVIMLAMADYFGVSVDELLGRDPDIKKEPAPPGGMRESVMRLFDEIEAAGLSDAEAEYIRAQIEGIKALRKPG